MAKSKRRGRNRRGGAAGRGGGGGDGEQGAVLPNDGGDGERDPGSGVGPADVPPNDAVGAPIIFINHEQGGGGDGDGDGEQGAVLPNDGGDEEREPGSGVGPADVPPNDAVGAPVIFIDHEDGGVPVPVRGRALLRGGRDCGRAGRVAARGGLEPAALPLPLPPNDAVEAPDIFVHNADGRGRGQPRGGGQRRGGGRVGVGLGAGRGVVNNDDPDPEPRPVVVYNHAERSVTLTYPDGTIWFLRFGRRGGFGGGHGGLGGGRVGLAAGRDGPDEVKLEKKTGKKARRRDTSSLNIEDYESVSATDTQASQDTLADLKDCKRFEDRVCDINARNQLLYQHSAYWIPFITLYSDLSPENLHAFYRDKEAFHLLTYPIKIPVRTSDGTTKYVPVTPDKEPSIEDRTHHIIAFTRRSDRTRALVLIENYSGYAVAFKVVYFLEYWMNVPWCLFGNEELAPRFKPWVRINYGPSYTSNLDRVVIHKGLGDKIIRFFESFRIGEVTKDKPLGGCYDQAATDHGHLMIESFLAFACEGPRFLLVELWAIYIRGRIPNTFSLVIKDWLALCKCVHLLLLYLRESEMSHVEGDLMYEISQATRERCLDLWEARQDALVSTELRFFNKALERSKQEMPNMDALAGSQLKLLRNDKFIWDQILMRNEGYAGRWIKEIGRQQESAVGGAAAAANQEEVAVAGANLEDDAAAPEELEVDEEEELEVDEEAAAAAFWEAMAAAWEEDEAADLVNEEAAS